MSDAIDRRIAAFLNATRGSDARSKYSPDPLNALVDLATEHLATPAGGASVALSQPYSHGFDVETVSIGDRNHIVLDQSFLELDCRLNELVLPLVMGGLENPAPRAVGSGLATLMAVRHVMEGRLEHALALALLPGEPRGFDHGDLAWRRASCWALVQACFAATHELGHCRNGEGEQVIARSWAAQFEDEMQPMAEFYDTQVGSSLSNPFLEHIQEIRDRSDSDEEFASLLAAFQSSQQYRRDLSRLEMLDSVIDESNSVGEEVLCDYMAFRMVDGIQDSFGIPPDEVLLAAYCGMVYQIQLGHIGNQINSSGPWAQPLQHLVRKTEDYGTRLWFGRLCVAGLTNSNQREWEKTLQGKPPQADLRHIAEVRTARIWDRMAKFDQEWFSTISRAAMDSGPLQQIAARMAGGLTARLFAKVSPSFELARAVADVLGTPLHPSVLPPL